MTDSNASESGQVELNAGLEPGLQFRFIEFNEVRALRGKEAARVAVIDAGAEHWLWMSKADIGRNMMEFGRHPELTKAHDAYRF